MADIDRKDLAALIEAVEAGDDAGFRRANRAVFSTPCQDMALQLREEHCRHAYKGYLDAAKDLHEALLPGYFIDFKWWTSMNSGAIVTVGNKHEGKSLAPARAWLLAILRALAAEGGE